MRQDALRQLTKAANLIRRKMRAFGDLEGLTFAQTRVLYFILRNSDEVYQKDIEEEYMLRPSTATALLQSMEQLGLIERVQSFEDGRRKQILPTEKGDSLKMEVEQKIDQLEQCLARGLTREELEAFFRITDKMIENLKDEANRE